MGTDIPWEAVEINPAPALIFKKVFLVLRGTNSKFVEKNGLIPPTSADNAKSYLV